MQFLNKLSAFSNFLVSQFDTFTYSKFLQPSNIEFKFSIFFAMNSDISILIKPLHFLKKRFKLVIFSVSSILIQISSISFPLFNISSTSVISVPIFPFVP